MAKASLGSETVADLRADAEEVDRLLASAVRPGVVALLRAHANELKEAIERKGRVAEKEQEAKVLAAAPEMPRETPIAPPSGSKQKLSTKSVRFTPIDRFAWDQPGFSSKFITVYVTLDGVGGAPSDNVTCEFTERSFDLKVMDLNGKNYRLLKNNLFKNVDVGKSTYKVKKNKVVIKLRKEEGKYGPENWTDLVEKNPKKKSSKSDDPTAGLNDLIKDMYDSGDDNMKKIIGEAMLKSRQNAGRSPSEMDMDDFKV